jgi:hypothetical protein
MTGGNIAANNTFSDVSNLLTVFFSFFVRWRNTCRIQKYTAKPARKTRFHGSRMFMV